ncbi:MAG: hypothetical protein KUG73_02025, partial [Pseudomonadales bacterium]|nr:hypothetical protein [Pseudomonadales bacterium]
ASIVMLEMLPVSVQAGGSHEHDHKMSGHEMSKKEMHQHDGEGSAVGKPATEADATKTIQVVTKDFMRYAFSPEPDIKAGDVVTFIITNEGQIPHEFSIGDKREQDAHRKMMQKMPDMVHEDGNTITVKPGETKKLTWNFSGTVKGSSEVVFACNVPGHFEAGMFHKMIISKAP